MALPSRKVAVVAVGGNSLIQDPARPQVRYQWDAVRETCTHVAEMVERGWDLVITHGNGPQVGFILRRNELAAHEVHQTPLDLIDADTQGSIGYMLQQALGNEMYRRKLNKRAVTVITQTLVAADDPAFQHPSKPIGAFLSEEQARMFMADGWSVLAAAGAACKFDGPLGLFIELGFRAGSASQGETVLQLDAQGRPQCADSE